MVAQIGYRFIRTRPLKVWPRLIAYLFFEGRPLTTRGRWINPVVFLMYQIWSWFPAIRSDANPIFILGLGRTGTTVMGTILALHRDVGYLNEPKAMWHAATGDDDLIGSYSDKSGRYIMSEEDVTPEKMQKLRRFHSAFLTLSNSTRIVDKYPELLFKIGFIDAIFPNARKIVLIRDGIDTCLSIKGWSQANQISLEKNTDDWWGRNHRKWFQLVDELVLIDSDLRTNIGSIRSLTCQTDRAAVEWIVTMRMVMALRVSNRSDLFFIKYENLVEAPEDTMSKILNFSKLKPDSVLLSYAKSILRPKKDSPRDLVLSPVIQNIFDQTMQELGYVERKLQ